MKRYFIFSVILFTVFNFPASGFAQNESEPEQEEKTIVIPPLFQYPVVPDGMDWVEGSEWLAEHFWDDFDFKQASVGQQPLNHAFATWTFPLRYAKKESAMRDVEALIKKLDKNPTLLLQFTRAAEYSIYSPTSAQTWIDEIYLPFLTAVAKNKKVSKAVKARYAMQQKVLENTRIGNPVPAFNFTSRSMSSETFSPAGKFSIVEFGDPSCSDCQMARIALKTDDLIRELMDGGYLDIFFIIPDVEKGDTSWIEEVYDYPDSWIVGAAEGLDEILDIRVSPSLYLFDSSGNLLMKNVNLNDLRQRLDNESESLRNVRISVDDTVGVNE